MPEKPKNGIDDLQQELKKSRETIKKLKEESRVLRKAIWDMLNYSNMYVLLLDSYMTIRLINWSLAKELGFSNEQEVIGKSWLDFIPDHNKELVKIVHDCLSHSMEQEKYRELVNEVKRLDNSILVVKWFNIPINSNYNMTFSMGLKSNVSECEVVSEDSIRSYYRDIIAKDRTMIKSLKDVVVKGYNVSVAKEK
jgi:PAS domain S-box-containing protein